MIRTITTCVFVIIQTISGLTFNQLRANFKVVQKYPLQTEKKHQTSKRSSNCSKKKSHSLCRSSFEN